MKKKWLWIVPGILAVAVIVFLTMLWFANKKSLSMTETVSFEAQYIRTNGYHESIDYPVVRVIRSAEELKSYYESNKELYDLERRDKVYADMTIGFLDACDKYKVFKSDGVETDAGSVVDTMDANRVSASHGEHTLSISIPEGWEYEIKEYSDESSSFGIFFWPEGETEGKLSFLYYDAWGVCGTGLESETIEIGGYEASQGNYNGGIWEFICFQKEPGWCVIKNDAAYAWLGKHIDEAMEIIDTVRLK